MFVNADGTRKSVTNQAHRYNFHPEKDPAAFTDAKALILGSLFRAPFDDPEIIRAADEAIAFQCADLIKAMEQDMQAAAGSIRVDGGAARDEFLLQFQADMLNHDIERPDYVESTALGAVRLAMMATGLAAKRGEGSKTFKPNMSEAERAEHLARWKKALKGVLDAAE